MQHLWNEEREKKNRKRDLVVDLGGPDQREAGGVHKTWQKSEQRITGSFTEKRQTWRRGESQNQKKKYTM